MEIELYCVEYILLRLESLTNHDVCEIDLSFCLRLTFARFHHGVVPHCMTTPPLGILSTAHGHLDCFQLGTMTNKAGMNFQKACVFVHVCVGFPRL